jgi:hypothetical protein
MRILGWFSAKLAAWQKTRRVHGALNEQGFLVFCECREVLNLEPYVNNPCEGLYTWRCSKCGRASTFDVRSPVPLIVGASDVK